MGLYLCTSVVDIVGLGDGGASERGQGAHEKRSAARERREGAGGRARRIRARSGEHRRHPRINDQKPDPSRSLDVLAHEIPYTHRTYHAYTLGLGPSRGKYSYTTCTSTMTVRTARGTLTTARLQVHPVQRR